MFSRLTALISAQPIFLAQMCSSAAGALGMVFAAIFMAPNPFTIFSLLTLATQLCTGAARAFLFQPALIETRTTAGAHIHVRAAMLGAIGAAGVFFAAALLLGVDDLLWLIALSASCVLPVLTEWLRLRAMALNERWNIVRGDALRLAATLLAVPVLLVTTDAKVFFLFVNMTYATTIGLLALRLGKVDQHISPLRFWRPASSQLADFMLSQTISTIPLLVLAGFESSVYIGGIRMAQTLFGPLHLVVYASAMNLLADGATEDAYSKPRELIRHGRRLAAILSLFCGVLVVLLIVFLVWSGLGLRGVDNQSLTVGVVLTGAYALTAALSYPDTIVMRLLGHHTVATVGRFCVVCVTAAGYGIGYALGGVDLSLIVAFICSAVANPLALTIPATIIYRRYRRSEPNNYV